LDERKKEKKLKVVVLLGRILSYFVFTPINHPPR